MTANKKWVRIEIDVKVEPGAVFVEGQRVDDTTARSILSLAAQAVPRIRTYFPPYEDPVVA